MNEKHEIIDELDKASTILEFRIKKDKLVVVTLLSNAIGAYSPIPGNITLSGGYGVGKSHNTVQTIRLFPEEDTQFLVGISKKSLAHDHGELIDIDNKPIRIEDKPEQPRKKDYKDNPETYEKAKQKHKDDMNEWYQRLRGAKYLVNMEGKIIVFLETPNEGVLDLWYPMLSHDKKEVMYKFTDKLFGTKMQTVKVVIRGYPACFFLSAEGLPRILKSRCRNLEIEVDAIKIKGAQSIKLGTKMFPWNYEGFTKNEEEIRQLIRNIRYYFKDGGFKDVLIPFPGLNELFPHTSKDDMRLWNHFIDVQLTGRTMFNMFHRVFIKKDNKSYVLCNVNDIIKSYDIYRVKLEAEKANLTLKELRLYWKVMRNEQMWLGAVNIVEAWHEKYPNEKLSRSTLYPYLKHLEEANYITSAPQIGDKRVNNWIPQMKPEDAIIAQKIIDSVSDWQSKVKSVLDRYYFQGWRYYMFIFQDLDADMKLLETQEISIEQALKEILCIV